MITCQSIITSKLKLYSVWLRAVKNWYIGCIKHPHPGPLPEGEGVRLKSII